MDYIIRAVNNSQLKTLQSFIDFYSFLGANGQKMTTKELLAYKAMGETNSKRIRNSYEPYINKGAEVPTQGNEADLIYPSTVLAIPVYAYQRDFIRVETNVVQNYDVNNITKDAIYNSTFARVATYNFNGIESRYKKTFTKIKVWIWCRALGDFPNGKVIDVSMFVKSLSTNVAQNGGNFNITLASIMCEWDNGKIKPIYHEYEEGGVRQYYAKSSTIQNTTNGTKRSQFYFHQILRANDLVFITFDDELVDDSSRREFGSMEIDINSLAYYSGLDGDALTVGKASVTGEVFEDLLGNTYSLTKGSRRWDMIGLIDSNTQQFSPTPPSVSITISGRDIFKVLIDDQEKFFPLEYAGVDIYGMFNNLKNNKLKSLRAQRRLDGELSAINVFVDNTIEECLVFIFSHLSHIEIAPDSVFTSWGDNRSKYKYPISIESVNQTGKDVNGGQVDTSFKRVTGFEEEVGAGIWGIIKILVDDSGDANSLKIRRVVDSSIRTEQGSLVNYINRVCQPPFVEFWGDTIGNQYFLNVRKPPFDEANIKRFIKIYDEIDELSDNTFHLREINIASEALSFDDSEVYSWYRVNPTGNFLGDSSTFVNAYLPVIFFPEFAEIYGAKALEVTSNYIDFAGTLRGGGSAMNLSYLEQMAIADLRFLVETHAYLPFTRKGTITIDLDYRYKKGMFVRHYGTDEIYHIDSVQHQYNVQTDGTISSSTTLTVSHGMVDKMQTNGLSTLDMYFKLINYDDNINKTAENYLLINWTVDRDIFEYLMKGLQFSNEPLVTANPTNQITPNINLNPQV